MIYDKELDANLKVCPKCQYHFPIGARERINALVETCSFEENDASMESVDILTFTGVSSYTSKLEQYTKATNLKDAVCTGIGRIGKYRVALGVMDFRFIGRLDGVGGRRKADAPDRSGDGQGIAGHHHFHQRRRADV